MCYMEKQQNIEVLDKQELGAEMCINTEWGAFGDNSGSLKDIRTQFDIEIDENSPNKGEHMSVQSVTNLKTNEPECHAVA